MPRRIIALHPYQWQDWKQPREHQTRNGTLALCDDGSAWVLQAAAGVVTKAEELKWRRLPDIPQD